MRGLLIIMLLFIVTACTTTKYIEVPVEVETVRTEYVNRLYKDSIFVHDSIDRYISGDTVYQLKYSYIYKYMNRTDTLCKTDSIQVPVEIRTTEVKEVNHIKWYQSLLMYLGIAFLAVLSYRVYKLFKK